MFTTGLVSRRRFMGGLAVAAVGLPAVIDACGSSGSTSASGPAIKLKFSSHEATDSPNLQAFNGFAYAVNAKTGGQVQIAIYPNAELYPENGNVKAVNDGTIDMTIASDTWLNPFVPELGTEALPFIFPDWATAVPILQGRLGAELSKRIADKTNVVALQWIPGGFRHMLFRDKRVTSLPDMKGLRMRSPQIDLYVTMLQLLGAKPSLIAYSETYTALQAGVVDGMETPLIFVIAQKFYEVTKHVALTAHIFNSITFMMNKQKLHSLPSTVQQVIQEEAAAMVKKETADLLAQQNSLEDQLRQKGMTVDPVQDHNAWVAATKPMIADWVKKYPGAASLLTLAGYSL